MEKEELKKYLIEYLSIKEDKDFEKFIGSENLIYGVDRFLQEKDINLMFQYVLLDGGDYDCQCGFWKENLLIIFKRDVSFIWLESLDELVEFIFDLWNDASLINNN